MHGSSLAIILCAAFDNCDEDPIPDTGWTAYATRRCDATLDAIHAHYADALAALLSRAEAAERERDEARALLTRIAAERDACGTRDLLAENAALSAEVERLREALAPFADYAEPRGVIPGEMPITAGSRFEKHQITMGDCRRARAALARSAGEGEAGR
jgi:hypothetical protein